VFRRDELPGRIKGQLYLHSMPGRCETLDVVWSEITRLRISASVCLAPMDEIREKSPQYAQALEHATVPSAVWPCPICDYQGPANDDVFIDVVTRAADSLRAGEGILVHRGAGVGRTGLFAVATLMALGLAENEARKRVVAAGSRPERTTQDEALRRIGPRVQGAPGEGT
jgi:protein-tyrosine phosphatase